MTRKHDEDKAAKSQAASDDADAKLAGKAPLHSADTSAYPGIPEGLAPDDPKLIAALDAKGEPVKPGEKPAGVNFDASDRDRLAALEQRIAVLEGRQAAVNVPGGSEPKRTPADMTRAGAQTEGRAPQTAVREGEGDDYHVSCTGNATPLAATELDVKAHDEADALAKFYAANGVSRTAVTPTVTKGKQESLGK